MSRMIPGPPTPGARRLQDQLLSEKREERRQSQNARSDLEYRMLSRAVGLSELNQLVDGIRSGDQRAIDAGIDWLELDPFCMFSGYAKQRLLRALRNPKLLTRQASRLRRALLEAFTRGPRQEFRDAKRLTRRLDSDEFRQALEELRRSDDPGTAQRATWVLDSLDR